MCPLTQLPPMLAQIRMYREAMQHLMPGPKKGDPQYHHTDTDTDTDTDEASHPVKRRSFGSLSALASQVRGANQTRMRSGPSVREGGTTDLVHLDTTSSTASSDARPNLVARMHVRDFYFPCNTCIFILVFICSTSIELPTSCSCLLYG